ncbi:phosphomannomutase, putative [Plasmodium ovale curtisi]|uniref:Phosphomannomutase n=1 Tax=Plasmodium ovale curtisi TaxID=864141 RepID=A0A1A8WE49_PLAOA|nr:phosphomannomutase, putative [Plasmodium ovale curtisi]
MTLKGKNVFFLFDVDGTLTNSRKVWVNLRVGGTYPGMFEFIFSENGVVAHKNNEQYFAESIVNFLGEDKLKELINYCLVYISNLDIPKKRGTFIELRNAIINVSPIGRNCSQEERDEFCKYNTEKDILKKFRQDLMKRFGAFNLTFSIGGQISIDCFPTGWDKTFCLRHIEGFFSEIYFLGDKTEEVKPSVVKGGNDYEIYNDKRVQGYSVRCPDDTIERFSPWSSHVNLFEVDAQLGVRWKGKTLMFTVPAHVPLVHNLHPRCVYAKSEHTNEIA